MQTPHGPRDARRRACIAADWLAVIFNPSLPVSPHAHADRLGPHRVLRRRRALRVAAAAQCAATRPARARCASALLRRRGARAGAGLRRRPARPQHARAPAAPRSPPSRRSGRPSAACRWCSSRFPNEKERRNDYAIDVPNGASLILRARAPTASCKGLNAVRGKHPPVAPVFFAFRVMVGVGVLMIAVVVVRRVASRAASARAPRWLLCALAAMTFSGWVATLAGWMVTEIGRQPWLVHGVLRTAEAAASVPAALDARASLGATCSSTRADVRRLHGRADAPRAQGARRDRRAHRGAEAAARRWMEGTRMTLDLPLIFMVPDGPRDPRLRGARRLRPRRRHAAAGAPTAGARRDGRRRSARSGTPTRPGWCSASASCWSPSRWRTA